MQTVPNTALSEMAALCGYDFLILDVEHGYFSEMDCLQALQTLRSTATAALIRLRGHDATSLGHYLDMGADGVLAPNVSTAAQARDLVRAMVYPPNGTRGCAGPMARGCGYGTDFAVHVKSPRDGLILAVMIETALGVANIEEILAVEGVDAVVVGPFDLSADMGYPAEFLHPAYVEALARIEKAAAAHGKLIGTAPHQGNTLESLLERGHRLITIGTDITLIREAMTARVAGAKAALRN